MRVDTLFVNAVVHTGTAEARSGPEVARIAVLGGQIVALGADCDGLDARHVVDLAGRSVVPGFHDAHNHMAWFGLGLGELRLSSPPVASVEQIYDLVAAEALRRAPGALIVGSGYDQNKLGGAHPTREALDRAAPRHRVWLRHTSGHMCVVNSAVLSELDLDHVGDGGDVVLDAGGSPTGLLREKAQLLLRPLTYPVPAGDLARAVEAAAEVYLKEGITSVQEAGIGGGLVGRSPVELAAYEMARERGGLKVRTTLMVTLETLHDLEADGGDEMSFGLDLGMRSGFGDDWLRIGPVKIFADGSLIGRTAALSSDYSDDPGNRGYFQLPLPELREAILRAHRSGWQIATHAIGDLAVSTVLDLYEEGLSEEGDTDAPRKDRRHRIEHCGVCRPEDVSRMARLGIVPVPQGRFVNEIGDGMLAALGEERAEWCYRGRSFLDAGIVLPASSDRPVVEGAPLLGLADLVRRRTSSGAVLAGAEAITPAEALRAYTWGSAYAAFLEHRVGSIAPGLLADFAVLSADPLAVLADEQSEAHEGAGDLAVVATVVGGESVYDPDGLLGA
ncbi:MAG: amidohydrolase [Acidimicrobiales bacterium]